ncbi:YncE family protein [Actinoplanes sp. DH11]|uniref:YncE family protein n=1 Tax=Actinoplanes sp. DH11 TaxID=2857011 RepID=UPI001E42CEB5|nr:hypothetical protein [Actinoplanes sp. DH11]
MAGPSLVIRFGAGRITLALDDDTASGLPVISHRDTTADRDTAPAELSGLLSEVLRDAVRPVPRALTVVHPVGWDEQHRTALSRAAAAAGVGRPAFLIGPVAVAHAVATGLRRRRAAAVVTLGGPLAEVAVLIRTRTGFTQLGEASGVLVPHTPEGRRRVVGELLTTIATAGLTAERLAGVYVVGDTEPGAPLAAEIQRTLGVPTSARRELETAAVDGALTAYPRKTHGLRRRTRVAAAAATALILAASGGTQLAGTQLAGVHLGGVRWGGGADPADARFVAATAAPAPLVHVLDADAGRLSTLNTGTGLTSPAATLAPGEADWFHTVPDGRTAVIGNAEGILLVDTAARRVRHRVAVPGATATAVSADSRTVYVLAGSPASVVPVDVASGAAGKPVTAGRQAGQMVAGPGGVLYVLEPAARLGIVDTAAGTSRTIALHRSSREIVLTPDGKRLYVAADRWLGPYDTGTGRLLPPLELPGKITALAATPDGRSVLALCTTATGMVVAAVDVAGGRVRAEIPMPGVGNAWRLSAAPGGQRAYVYGSADTPVIGWIDTAADRAGPPIRVGAQPWEIVHRSDGSTAYVLTRLDANRSALVSVDAATGTAGRVFDLPAGPVVIATPG